MSQKLTFYPLGNAQTCLLELSNKKYYLFDFAAVFTGTTDDKRYDIKSEFDNIEEFEVVAFSHAHEDHVHGASDFFYFEHADKYKNGKRIKELWISSEFLMDSKLENDSDAKKIRAEAIHRLRSKKGIKIFSSSKVFEDWLFKQNIEYNDIKHLVFSAGTEISKDTFNNEMSIFVHAPFYDENSTVQDDKNVPSIVMQLTIYNSTRSSKIVLTGDANYKVLDEIVNRTKEHKNEESLYWDIYDVPHHCSHTGLNEHDKLVSGMIDPTDNVKWLLQQSDNNAYVVASCSEITQESNPPHLIAKKAYEKFTNIPNEHFIATMEHCSGTGYKPEPVVFEFDHTGVTKKQINLKSQPFTRQAPRAGKD